MLMRKGRPCGLYLVVSAVFLVSISCFLVALRSFSQDENKSFDFKSGTGEGPIESMLAENMFYIDKANYRMAIGYEDVSNTIGINQDNEEDVASIVESPLVIQPRLSKTMREIGYDNVTNNNGTNEPRDEPRDDEESIDQNPVAERYKDEVNGKVSKFQCSPANPVSNLVLIKTHRTGSTSVGNIFYRYGDMKNLSFVLPTSASFQYYWPLRFHPSHTRLDLLNKALPNMAINVGRYSKQHILPMMPNNTVALTILRDPIRHFESVYEYADISRLIGLSNVSRDPFAMFLAAPRSSVIEFVKGTKSFAIELNLLKNGMAFDLGLEHSSYSNDEEIQEFIESLEKQLDLVLISEHMDESLVLLKRLMCWKLDDVVYMKHKVRNNAFRNNITDTQKEVIKSWNQADVMLYHHFNKSLWDKIGQQGDDFFAEVENFRSMVDQITNTCFESKKASNSFEVPIVLKTEVSEEMGELCEKLMRQDRNYIKILKEKQRKSILNENRKLVDEKFYRESDDSRIYFTYENSTTTSSARNDSRFFH